MAKIIINASNLKGGGAIQVAVTFMEGLKDFKKDKYFIFLPPAIHESIKFKEFPSNISFYNVNNPRVISIFGFGSKELSDLEKNIEPDCVFSFFGPTYWKPKSWHIMGFANGLYLYWDLPYILKLTLARKLFFNLKKKYHRILLKRDADFFIVQTEEMKKRLAIFLNISTKKIAVNYGSYHPIFTKKISELRLLPKKNKSEFWFITISSFYPHKNLDVINKVLDILKLENFEIKVKFVLTLPDTVFQEKFKHHHDSIINIGPVSLSDCPYLYNKSDALFLPTLVESFTASYPEAMIMGKPILTSDYEFSRLVCENSALYFDPYNPNDIVDKVIQIISNKALYESLVKNGLSTVKKMPTFNESTKKYLEICGTWKTKSNYVDKIN
jgi:glycosyltransferase involved in cell wall biosynthesis